MYTSMLVGVAVKPTRAEEVDAVPIPLQRGLYHDSSEREHADRLLRAEQAPAQSCIPNGGLISLVEVASLQSADANRAVWP